MGTTFANNRRTGTFAFIRFFSFPFAAHRRPIRWGWAETRHGERERHMIMEKRGKNHLSMLVAVTANGVRGITVYLFTIIMSCWFFFVASPRSLCLSLLLFPLLRSLLMHIIKKKRSCEPTDWKVHIRSRRLFPIALVLSQMAKQTRQKNVKWKERRETKGEKIPGWGECGWNATEKANGNVFIEFTLIYIWLHA